MRAHPISIALLLVAIAAPCRAAPPVPLSRITTDGPRFVDARTHAPFTPHGNTYLVLEKTRDAAGNVLDIHCNFMEDVYDAAQVERDLADMAAAGNNVVRVFLGGDASTDHARHWGIGGPPGSTGLHEPYVANFIDFVRRANAHGLRVVPITPRLPSSADYQEDLARDVPANVTDENTFYLSAPAIDAKAHYLAALVARVKAEDLLTTILYWEVDSEHYVLGNAKPFSLDSGTVATADGHTYDMANEAERQECAESNMANWANHLVDAIHAVDPDALVTAPVFSNRAVGRTHVASRGIHLVGGGDPRFPIDPTVMRSRSRFSFTTIDAYPDGSARSLDDDLAELDFAHWDLAKMPVSLGEFGAFKSVFPRLDARTAQALVDYRDRAAALGFAGFIFWVWSDRAPPAPLENSDLQSAWWTASALGGLIDHALATPATATPPPPPATDPSLVFDEAYYLATYPDVADAVKRGALASGRAHYDAWGAREGRSPNGSFDERAYLGAYDDAAASVKAGTHASGWAHYLAVGHGEGRSPHPAASLAFDEDYYRKTYTDVSAAIDAGTFTSGRDHYDRSGASEGRNPNSLFDEASYLARYPDVASAVRHGDYASGWTHFRKWGYSEGRSPK